MNCCGTPFLCKATAQYFQFSVFYMGGKLTSYHFDTNISHQRQCGLSYEKEANTTPNSGSVIRHNVIYSTSQCALIAQKYTQAVRFRIPSHMGKKFLWMFHFLSSAAMTPRIIQIWRLIFVLEPSNLRCGKRIEVCINVTKHRIVTGKYL